jgi:hypothetical protein
MTMSRRNFLASLLATACILFVGGLLFRDSAAGIQLSVVAALAVGHTLLFVLDGRERRRNERKH